MSNARPAYLPFRDQLTFFQEFIKHPLQIGSVIPSSRFLEQRLLKIAELKSVHTIVELGSGTGGTTQAILRAMPAHARLLSIEINPQFYRLIKKINDARLIAHLGSAAELNEILAMYGLHAPEVIISGIPFSTMSHSAGSEVLAMISAALADKGRFVAYQVSNRVTALCEPFLGAVREERVFLNLPPMRLLRWEKHAH